MNLDKESWLKAISRCKVYQAASSLEVTVLRYGMNCDFMRLITVFTIISLSLLLLCFPSYIVIWLLFFMFLWN